jgi:hypothetical protein
VQPELDVHRQRPGPGRCQRELANFNGDVLSVMDLFAATGGRKSAETIPKV